MKAIVALICLCLIHQTLAAADTCLATADLATNCDPAPTTICTAGTPDCSTFIAENDCTTKSCIWTAGATCADGCSAKPEDDCAAPCTVDGTCLACGNIETESTCTAKAGCTWADSQCQVNACTSNESACSSDNFCTWASPACNDKTDAAYCSSLDHDTAECEADLGCKKDNPDSPTDCIPKVCSDLDHNTADCEADLGCKKNDLTTPTDCIPKVCGDFTEVQCATKGSCTWDASVTPAAACVDKVCGKVACTGDDDCAWSGSTCEARDNLCSKSDKTSCNDISRCSWKFNACEQPAGNCSDNNQTACTDAAECTWTDGSCSVNATCVGHTSLSNCCTNGCAWVDCKEKVVDDGADMLNIAISTLVLSLMSVKLLL